MLNYDFTILCIIYLIIKKIYLLSKETMGNKNNKNKAKKSIHIDENKDFINNSKNINNMNITESIMGDYIIYNIDSKPKNKNESKKIINNINNSKQFKSFENKINEKSIKFYYDNEIKIIKYQGKLDLKSVKTILKSYFLIEESIDNIFFTDEEDDILILNSNIPDNLKVNLFIQKDLIPKNPATSLKIKSNKNSNNKSQKPLLKFYWIIENDKKRKRFADCIVNKYIYRNLNNEEVHPSVKSSVSFTVGTYFFVIRVGTFVCYESLAIVEDEYPDFHNIGSYNKKTFVGYQYMEGVCGHKRTDIAIYIDMEKKKCRFYDYEKKQVLLNGKINSDSVKLYAWLKSGARNIERGMTILNEGCIPIPDWVKP